jgi:Cupin domain
MTCNGCAIHANSWKKGGLCSAAQHRGGFGCRAHQLYSPAQLLEGELTVKRNGQTSILHQGGSAVIEPGVWHDWWNASDLDARVRVEITPGERFVHMIETFFGLARLGYTDSKGMPNPLQLALCAREFGDVLVFRSPPLAVQHAIFGALAPIARWRGYRATYPQLSRIVLAPRTL